MEKVINYYIPPEDDGLQVKAILKRKIQLSTTQIKRAKFREMGITLNGQHVTVRAVAHTGDLLVIRIEDPQTESQHLEPMEGELDVVYEDDEILVVNKPAGLPVHPSPGHYKDTLANLLVYYFRQRGLKLVVRTLGRLDKDTSGLILVAKNAPAQTALERQRAEGTLRRIYLALTEGQVNPPEGTVDAPIARKPGSLMVREVSEEGVPAVTDYKTLMAGEEYSFVRLHLHSGRTHQIRVHMSWMGHPLLGDFLYGTEGLQGMTRTALHSAQLSFIHPGTGEPMCIDCPLPEDMQTLVDHLKK